jgi:Ser/Thr protein kinase RdoA (MazF antagonist)
MRLRRLGRTALASYGLEDAPLTLRRYGQNTTFRVDAHDRPYLLRINRPRVHTADTIGSEMAWLSALRRDTDLGVPEPVAACDGSFIVVARDPGVPGPHVCVLLHWLDGRFINQRLRPAHLRRVGALVLRSSGQRRERWRRRPVPSASSTEISTTRTSCFHRGEARAIHFDDCG